MNGLKQLFKSNKAIFFFYALFVGLSYLSHWFIVGLISFFHFQLGHRLFEIESWLFRNAWPVFFAAKGLGHFFFYQWMRARLIQLPSVTTWYERYFIFPFTRSSERVWVGLLCFYIISWFFSSAHFEGQYLYFWWQGLLSWVGTSLFFGIDFFILMVLIDHFPLKMKNKSDPFWLFLALALVMNWGLWLMNPYHKGHFFFYLPVTLSLFFISNARPRQFGLSVFFLLLGPGVMAILLGLDPFWGDRFSWMRLPRFQNYEWSMAQWIFWPCFWDYLRRKSIEDYYPRWLRYLIEDLLQGPDNKLYK